ncbi:MAG: DNA methylase [Dolichospermum sp. LBC05a]|nr:type I restriction enzyme HsdR N-terminal domain-containing protein [Dolichospermum sp. OL01]MCO5798647.1 type I restriction enzyme HsdR N-terminal domain-containing protein [Dolichospermum sp. OL03]MCS6283101.1 type I restriction enzyme HsdR N-terminal domain-containing protein [Dolichospermum sp.]QSV60071.1 MAG: DNA methylase [Dolichospermum sp. LBC05a]
MKLADILKDSNYKLSQFTAEEIAQLEQSIILKSSKSGEAPYTVCLVRKKEIKLTPEEAIRQLYLRVLTERFYYPLNRIQVEYGVNFGREVKRADIVVMDKDRLNTVYMLVEVKKPKLKDGKEQLRSYCHATGAPIAIWTNGDQISYYQRKDPNYFEEIPGLPNASQTLADILQIKFTLEDLVANDKLVKQNKSLKALIEEMEDEVLANAGVDVFEELFKLIFTKLYDEWYSGQGNRRKTHLLEFRNTGQTEAALKTKIQDLFDDDPKVGALCPRKDDYNIFFATMQKSGKDNSGEKIYVKNSDGSGEFLLDDHGHLIIDHDLFNHEGKTQDGIAEAFIEFAKKENFSFFKLSPSVAPFDAVKYQKLMDGLEAVELKLSYILNNNYSFRFDSEYFKKEYLNNLEKIETYYLGYIQFCDVINKITGGATPLGADYPETGVKFLRVQNIMQNYIDDSDLVYISKEDDFELKRSKLKEEDVLLTITGVSYGKSAVVTREFHGCNINQHSVKITLDKNYFLPYFISTFLNAKIGKLQSDKNIVGVTRPALDYQAIKNFKVPLASLDFQIIISNLVNASHLRLIESKDTYSKAEDLLLSELNLKDWQPTTETIAIKSFKESFLSSGRLDSEYYQPRYQKVMAIMRQSGFCIGDIVTLAKRKFQPEKQGIFNYIEIGNLSGEGFANSELVAMEEAPSRAQWIVKNNDVITSTVRPIRRLSALIESEQNNYICSSGFAVLKPIKIESEVLLVYLRSPIVCEILDLHTTASMYPAISTEDLLNIPITLPDESIRQQITKKVRESRQAREQSKQLLEIAKIGVEKAIETDEATATDWINQQLEILGIDINNGGENKN